MVTHNDFNWKTEMVNLGAGAYSYVQAGGAVGVSNAGLIVGKKNNIVIDTLAINQSEIWKNEITNISTNPTKYLINTHSHPDHFGGNYLFPEATNLSHSNCYSEMKRMCNTFEHGEKELFPGADINLSLRKLPDLIFNSTLNIYMGKRVFQLIHFGFAHTRGDIIVFIPEDNIVFCGDLLFYYSTPVLRGGYIKGWIDALSKLIDIKAKFYVPGHGPLCDVVGLSKCLDYLMLIYNESVDSFSKGLSFREAALKIPLGEYKEWTHPERVLVNVYRIYQDLKGEDLNTPEDPRLLFTETRELAKSGW